MAKSINRSIRNRLTLIIFTVSAATVLVGFAAIGYLDIRNLRRDLHMDALLHARFTGQNCVGALDFKDQEGANDLLKSVSARPYIRAVALYDNQDSLFTVYLAEGNETLRIPQTLPETAPHDRDYHVIEPIVFNGDKIGSIHLRASTLELSARIRGYIVTLSILMGFTLILALVLAGSTQHIISEPILHLAQITRRISGEADYTVRVEPQSDDEIGTLYQGFNLMLDQIQSRQQERERAENALRESEERFRNLVETSSDWIWEVDRQWRYTYASPKVHELLGYTPEDLMGKTPFELMVEEDAAIIHQIFDQKVQQKQPLEGLQNRNRHREGHVVVLETNAIPLLDKAGNVIGYRGVDRNITDRQRAEEALRQSEIKYRTLFTSITDPIVIFDRHSYEILDCNQPTLDRYGYSMSEIKTMTPLDFHPVEDRERIQEIIDENNVLHEYRHITKTGLELFVEVFSTPLEYQGRDALISIIRDISDRKQAEEEIRRTKNYLDNILNSMPSILVGVDKQGRITQWNHEARRQTGLDINAVIGRPLDAVIPELKNEMDHIFQALESRKIMKETRQSQLIGNESRYADLTVYPLITNGVDGAVIRIDDVTDRIRIEEMMIQSEKMLSVGGLAAGMAHEINNPLAGILQNIQVIENRLFGDLNKNHETAKALGLSFESIRDYMNHRGIKGMIETIMASGRRAAKIVDNMLSFSRKSDSRHLAQDLGVLMDQTLELAENDYDLKKKYDFRKIRISREYQSDMPKVQCEPSKIQQVLLNILKNGAQAMAQKTIDHEPPEFHIKIHQHEDMVRIEVADNGPGMDESVRRRVFEPFFTTKTVGVGTGLGLSVSYFIITENHRGRMGVESELDQGSNFIIDLPIQ